MASLKKHLHKNIDLRKIQNNRLLMVFFRVILYLVLASIMISIGWQAWPDIIVDFGQELYMPWRITQGDVLYRDIDYFYLGGPLSIYWDALWFYIFGPHFITLVMANLVLVILLIYLLEDWLKSISDVPSSVVSVSFFIVVFAFNRYTMIGNYNYLTPYSIPLFHGLIIILGTIASLKKWVVKKNNSWLWLSGILVGLTIINKIEVAITTLAVLISYIGAVTYLDRDRLNKRLVIIPIAAALPPLIAAASFLGKMSMKDALYNIFNQWVMLLDGRLAELSKIPFYKYVAGTNDIGGNLIALLTWGFIYLTVVLISILIVLSVESRNKKYFIFSGVSIFIFSIIYFLTPTEAWFSMMRPLPLLMAVLFLVSIANIIKDKKNLKTTSVWTLRLTSIVFAGMFLSKIALNTRIIHYGFILAMPATLLAIVSFMNWLPNYLNKEGASFGLKSIMLSILCAMALYYGNFNSYAYGYNDFLCCNKDTTIRTDSLRGPLLMATVKKLESLLGPKQTFTVIPEGTMLNFMLKKNNPTPYFHFLPQLYIIHDEQDIIDSVAKDPPDFIVIVHSDTTEYGLPFFGKNYGIKLNDWINKNYEVIWHIGGRPMEPKTIYGTSIAKKIKPKI